jgi:hypothetical protein
MTTIGGFLFDWNKTHLFNPKWTPHAKFHDAMTISLASMLGLSSISLLQKKDGNSIFNLKIGTLLPAYFWASMIIAFAFPNAKGLEAEFPKKVPRIGKIWLNEGIAGTLFLTLLGIGYLLERSNQMKKE